MNTLTTLQDLVVAVADSVRDMVPGVTTASVGQGNQMSVDGFGGRRPNHWQNSEVIFYEPQATLAGRTGANPFVVVAYDDGLFTFDHAFGGSGVPQGTPFFIVRNHGQGNPYRAYLRALQRAVDNLGVASMAMDTSLSTSAGLYTYTAPLALDTIYAITVHSGDTGPYELRPDQWDVYPGRGLRFANNLTVDYPWSLTLYGRKFGALPTALDGTIAVDIDEVVDTAAEYLNRTSARPIDQAKGQNLQAERIRFKRRHALPNERLIIP